MDLAGLILGEPKNLPELPIQNGAAEEVYCTEIK